MAILHLEKAEAFLRTGDSRRARHTPVLSFLNRYLINVEGAGSRPIKSNLRLRVRPLRGYFTGLRLCQKGLILDHGIIRRKSDVKSLLFHFYRLLLKNAALDGGIVSRPGLLHGYIGVGDFQTNLILELLSPQLCLPDLQLIANGIRLRYPIPQR